MECDFVHWGRSLLARCTKRPSDCAESAERSTMRRTLGERSGCTFVTTNSAFGGVFGCVANSVARAPQSNRKRRRFGCRTVGRRSLARALRYRPASPAAAAGRSPNARRSGRVLHCKRRGNLTSRSDQASHEGRRRQRECCRADCRRRDRGGGGSAIRRMSSA